MLPTHFFHLLSVVHGTQTLGVISPAEDGVIKMFIKLTDTQMQLWTETAMDDPYVVMNRCRLPFEIDMIQRRVSEPMLNEEIWGNDTYSTERFFLDEIFT